MGIKDFTTFRKKYAPSSEITVPLSHFKGHSIVIDGTNYLFINWITSWKMAVQKADVLTSDPSPSVAMTYFFKNLDSYLNRYKSEGVTPIFVFDGKHPEEKKETQSERIERKRAAIERLDELKEQRKNVHPLLGDPTLEGKLKQAFLDAGFPLPNTSEMVKEHLRASGVQALQAVGEGEQLAAMLVLEGYAAAMVTTDHDALTYGCPYVLTKLEGKQFTCLCLDRILEETGLTLSEFKDVCILLQCDYNKRIPRVGPDTIMKMFNPNDAKRCTCIEDVGLRYNTDCLNYQRCREMFAQVSAQDCSLDPILDK